MQQVQIFIEGERIELFKDETISLNQTIKNVKDLAKIYTEFSQSFTVPASKANNKVFKHYYRTDLTDGFDARIKTAAEIKLNGAHFKYGYIRLLGSNKEDNACTDYTINFVGETVGLANIIKDDELSDLLWLDNFDRVYSASDISTGLQTGFDIFADGILQSDAIIAPMISHTKNLYYDSVSNQSGSDGNMYPQGGSQNCGLDWYDLKYSIRVSLIVKAIEEQYNINFSDDFFTDSNSDFYGLYLWLHRNQGSVGGDDKNISKTILNYFNKMPLVSAAGLNVTSSQVSQQGVGIFSTVSDITFNISVSSSSATFDFLILDQNNAIVFQDLGNTGGFNYLMPTFTTENNKQYSIAIRSNDVFTVNNTSTIRVETTNTSSGTPYDITTAFTGSQVMAQETEFNIRQEIPKIKVMDFLSGLFKTFNLVAYVLDDGTIKVETADAFYAAGTEWDVTKYVDVEKAKVTPPIPYSEIKLTYADYKTYTAALYSQINGSEFGELDYKGENPDEWVGTEYSIVLPWQKMAYNRILDLNDSSNTTCQVGWFVDEGQKPYLGKPLIHYTFRRFSGTGIAFSLTGLDGSYNSVSNYHIPMNSEDIFGTGQSLNFYPENDAYTGTSNANTLFENYYRNSLTTLFDKQKRLFEIKAFLPLSILLKYTLADKFIINDKYYKINSIKTNLQTGESKLELLNEI